ncbi:MAG: sigma-70 family RNA polymerase sigma factor [Muribaculaceae bacterium]|nr:sigma-70 family RNA polymerase sigma factor [Muribaculaceae bacterium]
MTDRKVSEDPELTARLRSPDTVRAAFTEVIRKYSEPLYWLIRKMVRSHDDADDVLQNTFLKAWDNIENFRGEAKLSTWLYKIAINESLSMIDRERRRDTVALDAAADATADSHFDGDDLARRLREAVDSLPEKQRLVFNMKYFDDMKYDEISEILGTSVGALKASYHLATKKIEQYFDGD